MTCASTGGLFVGELYGRIADASQERISQSHKWKYLQTNLSVGTWRRENELSVMWLRVQRKRSVCRKGERYSQEALFRVVGR